MPLNLVSNLNPWVVLTGGPTISAGTQSQSAGTISFANSNNVSFGMNAGVVTASAAGGGGGVGTNFSGTNISGTLNTNGISLSVAAPGGGAAVNFIAGTTNANLQTVNFADANNVSFGLNGSNITASASQSVDTRKAGVGFTSTTIAGAVVAATNNTAGLLLAVPGYLTTAAQSDHSHNFATTVTAGSVVNVATANSAGATVGMPAFITTYAAQTTQTQAAGNIAGIGYTSTTQAGSTAGATQGTNGLSMAWPPFITTYVAQTTQTQPAGIIAGVGTTFAGTNITATMGNNSNGLALSLSVAAPGGGGAINFIAGTTNANLQTVSFADANNVSFGLNAGAITASASHSVQTQPAGNIAGVGTTFAGTNVTATMGMNSNGLALSLSAGAGGAGDGVNIVQIGTAGTSGTAFSASTGTVFLNGSNNITVSQNNSNQIVISGPTLTQYLTTARASNDAIGLNTALTANGVSVTANSSGLSLNFPAFLTTARASNDAIGLNSALTANGVSVTANSSGLSLNFPAFLTTAANSSHSHNFATTTTNGSVANAATVNSAGVTLAMPPWITTYVAQTTQTQAAGIIAGVGTTFAGTNITATMGNNSNGLALSLSVAAPGGGGGAAIQGSGTYTQNTGTVQFANSNNITFGLSNNGVMSASFSQSVDTGRAGLGTTYGGTNVTATMAMGSNGLGLSLSAAAPGAGAFAAGVSTDAVGTTGTVGNQIVFFAGNTNITLSQSANAGSASVSIFAPAGGGGAGVTLVEYEPFPFISTLASSMAQASLYVNSLILPAAVNAKYMMLGAIMTAGWTSSTPVTNSTATTSSSSSASAGQTINCFFFSDGADAGREPLLYTNNTCQLTFSTGISWTQSNSNTTTGTQTLGSSVAFAYGYPAVVSGTVTSLSTNVTATTWGTTTTASTNSSTSTGSVWPGATNNAAWTGSKLLFMPVGSTLTAGEYWVGMQRSSATVGGAIAGTLSFVQQSFTSYDSGSRYAPFGWATSAVPGGIMAHPAFPGGNGMFTTSYNSTSNYVGSLGSAGAIHKSHINIASVTNTSGTHSRFYNRFMGELF